MAEGVVEAAAHSTPAEEVAVASAHSTPAEGVAVASEVAAVAVGVAERHWSRSGQLKDRSRSAIWYISIYAGVKSFSVPMYY